jgi:catechol 2,3-dioxygenase-like lactoylglutathione lyase family enzyme
MISGFHHIVLFCRDTEESKEWYEQVGFAYKRGYDGMHWFALGDGEIMLHPGRVRAGNNAGIMHASVATLDDMFKRVKQAGLQPFDNQYPDVVLDAPVTRPWGDREFELQDPDGHRWAFTEVDDVLLQAS